MIINDSVVSRNYLIIKSCLVVNMLKCTAVYSYHDKNKLNTFSGDYSSDLEMSLTATLGDLLKGYNGRLNNRCV